MSAIHCADCATPMPPDGACRGKDGRPLCDHCVTGQITVDPQPYRPPYRQITEPDGDGELP